MIEVRGANDKKIIAANATNRNEVERTGITAQQAATN
jgi:hypothetical protein